MKNKFSFLITLIITLISCEYSAQPYKEGKKSYELHCAPCHGLEAEGLGQLYPNLYINDHIKLNQNNLVCMIFYGIGSDSSNARKTRFSDLEMPGFQYLDPFEISNILNYINAKYWHFEPFNIQKIRENLSECQKR